MSRISRYYWSAERPWIFRPYITAHPKSPTARPSASGTLHFVASPDPKHPQSITNPLICATLNATANRAKSAVITHRAARCHRGTHSKTATNHSSTGTHRATRLTSAGCGNTRNKATLSANASGSRNFPQPAHKNTPLKTNRLASTVHPAPPIVLMATSL